MNDDPVRTQSQKPSAATADQSPTTRSLFWTVFPSIMLPMFLAVADQTIVATALPNIAADLGEVERISWVVVSYLIANTIAAPVYGRLGDAYGRRRMILLALALFVAGSVACAFAPTVTLPLVWPMAICRMPLAHVAPPFSERQKSRLRKLAVVEFT